MVTEAVHSYVNLVNGLTRTTRDRALATARALLGHAGLGGVADEAGERVTKLADEIMLASRANRDLVEKLVAAEVDKAAARWGFVRSDEVDALRVEIAELRASLVRATVQPTRKAAARKSPGRPAGAKPPSTPQPPLGGDPATPAAGLESPAPDEFGLAPEQGPLIPTPTEARTAGRSSAAKKTAAKRTAAKRTAAGETPAKRTSTNETPAKRSQAKRAAAKKSASAEDPPPADAPFPADPAAPADLVVEPNQSVES